MNNRIWKKFIEYGSGFVLDAEREYDVKGEPLIFHLKVYGLWYPKDYELIGHNLNKLMQQAIKDGRKGMAEFKDEPFFKTFYGQ